MDEVLRLRQIALLSMKKKQTSRLAKEGKQSVVGSDSSSSISNDNVENGVASVVVSDDSSSGGNKASSTTTNTSNNNKTNADNDATISHLNENNNGIQEEEQRETKNVDTHSNISSNDDPPTNTSNNVVAKVDNKNNENTSPVDTSTKLVSSSLQPHQLQENHRVDEDGDIEMLGNEEYVSELNMKENSTTSTIPTNTNEPTPPPQQQEESDHHAPMSTTTTDTDTVMTKSALASASHQSSSEHLKNNKTEDTQQQQQVTGDGVSPSHLIPVSPQSKKVQELYQMLKRRQEQKTTSNAGNISSQSTISTTEASRLGALISSSSSEPVHTSTIVAAPPSLTNFHPAPFSQIPLERHYPSSSPNLATAQSSQFDAITSPTSSDHVYLSTPSHIEEQVTATVGDNSAISSSQSIPSESNQQQIEEEDDFTKMLMLHKAKKNEAPPVLDTTKKAKKNRRAHKKKNKQNKARHQRSLQIATTVLPPPFPPSENTGPINPVNQSYGGSQEIVDMDLSSPVDVSQQSILIVNTDSPVSSTTIQPPSVITEDDVNSIHNPAEFQQKNASLTPGSFEPLRPPGVGEQSSSLQGFGRLPPKRFFVSESNQRPYFPDPAPPPLLPPPNYPGGMPVHFQHMQRTPKRPYPPPAPILPPQMPIPPSMQFPAYHTEHTLPPNRKLLIRFDDSSSDESDNEADEVHSENALSNQEYNGMRNVGDHYDAQSLSEINENNKRQRNEYLMDVEPQTPPRKRARKERLKNFEPVDENDVTLLQEEVALKQNQLEEIREDLKQKESVLSQATEQMYAHEEKRIALEAKRKLLLAQLKEVAENIDMCIKDRDTFKMKISLHENIVQKKKEQLKKAMVEYKEANLELYEVQLHNSMLSEAARQRDHLTDLNHLTSSSDSPSSPTISSLQPSPRSILPVIRTPTIQQRKAIVTKKSPQFNGVTSFYPQKKSARPLTPPGPHTYQIKNRNEVSNKSEIEKKKEFLQNKKRLDELKAEIEEKKKHEALLRKKIGHPIEEEFISLSVPEDDKGSKTQEVKEQKEMKEPLTSPSDTREEEEVASQVDDTAGMAEANQIFKDSSTLFFVGECGGRLLFAPRGQYEKESFFFSVSDQLRFQTDSADKSSKEERASNSSSLTPFTRYESPLNAFRVYRSTSLFSLTTSNSKPTASAAPHTVDYDRFLCRNDLDGRKCTDPNCTYQHMEDYEQQDDGKSTFGKITDALRRGKNDKPAQKKPSKTHGVKYSSGNKKRDLRVIDEFAFDKNIRTLIANQTKTESRYYDKISSQEYEQHLEQYPSDIVYWIKFALKKIIEHENNVAEGITLALSVLSRGLEKNPRSHDLWLVYCDLYTSKLNPTADNEELQDIFAAATKKIGNSILMWFKLISTAPQLDQKISQIDRAINIFRQNGTIEQVDRSRSLIALMYEKLRVLCAAGKFEEAVNAVKGTYETPVITLNDDEEEEEQPSDLSTILTALHRSNLWLLAIAIHWKKEFPFAGHFVGSDFLALADKPLGINFTPDMDEDMRNDIARMLDMGLNLFSHMGSDNTNRDTLLLQLNKHYFLSISEPDFRMADKHFNDLFQRLKDERDNMLEKKPSHEIPERLTLHLDRVEERCKNKREANTIAALGQFYDGINRKMIKNDTYLWYKTILFFAQNQSVNQIVPSIWSYLYSYYDNITVEDVASFNKSHDEMVMEASDMMCNLLGLTTTSIQKNQLTGLWHYNLFAWLVYIVLEAIREQNKDAVKRIFEEALVVFGNLGKEKQKILEEYVEFMSFAGTREEYEGVVDMCLNQDMTYQEAMKQVSLTVQLARENPLLRALVSQCVVKDFVFADCILQRLLQSVDPKLKGDIFENALGLLQGDTAVAIKWAKHEFSQGNGAIAKVILFKILSTKPQALDVWDILLQISSLYARKHGQKESLKDVEELFEKMMKENPFLPYNNLQEYMARKSNHHVVWICVC